MKEARDDEVKKMAMVDEVSQTGRVRYALSLQLRCSSLLPGVRM